MHNSGSHLSYCTVCPRILCRSHARSVPKLSRRSISGSSKRHVSQQGVSYYAKCFHSPAFSYASTACYSELLCVSSAPSSFGGVLSRAAKTIVCEINSAFPPKWWDWVINQSCYNCGEIHWEVYTPLLWGSYNVDVNINDKSMTKISMSISYLVS